MDDTLFVKGIQKTVKNSPICSDMLRLYFDRDMIIIEKRNELGAFLLSNENYDTFDFIRAIQPFCFSFKPQLFDKS